MNTTANALQSLPVNETIAVPDFYSRAKKIVSDYIKSAVLIDDDWPTHTATFTTVVNDDDKNCAPEEALEVEIDESVENLDDSTHEFPILHDGRRKASSAQDNANRLLAIHDSFVKRGIICTGFKYTKQDKDIAPLLAKNADILILDWNFAGDSGSGALEILDSLKQNGQLQFVCIFTDEQSLSNIKAAIFKNLYNIRSPNDTDFDFKIGCFVFTLRNKDVSSTLGGNTSKEENLFEDAVSHIALHYGGYLQLSMLEMTSRHRNTMLSHLTRFSPEFDAAILSDSAQAHSPVTLGENLRSLLLDEWKIALEQSAKESAMEILSVQGRASYAAGLKSSLAHITFDFMYACLLAVIPSLKKPQIEALFTEKECESGMQKPFNYHVNAWLDSGAVSNLQLPGVSSANNAHKVTLAVLYALSHPERAGQSVNLEAISRDILKLDALFNQQILLPDVITQGTILKYDDRNYFICITPLCDSARLPEGYHSYTFLHAEKALPADVLKPTSDYCIFVEQGEPVCLHVTVKRPYVFEINDKYKKLVNGADNLIRARHRQLPFSAVNGPITGSSTPKSHTAAVSQERAAMAVDAQISDEIVSTIAANPSALGISAEPPKEYGIAPTSRRDGAGTIIVAGVPKNSVIEPSIPLASAYVAQGVPSDVAKATAIQNVALNDPEDDTVPIKFNAVGQLRTDFFLMLTASAASNASRVGVNRVEFIRVEKNSTK